MNNTIARFFVYGLFIVLSVGAIYLCSHHTAAQRKSLPPQEVLPTQQLSKRVQCAQLVFAGDLMQHLPQLTAARTVDGFDFNPSFDWIRERFTAADVAVVNLETTLSVAGPYTGYPRFRSPTVLTEAMAELGIDVALQANNHSCDGGSQGIRTTIEALTRQGIAHTGVFLDSTDYRRCNPLCFEVDGIRFALFNYTYGTNGLTVSNGQRVNSTDTLQMAADLEALDRHSVDCIIACMHWGEEYERWPSRTQQRQADFLRRRGVDLIVGSHPHVIQPYTQDSSGVVIYSLGNFVSNQRKRYSDGGLVATVEVIRQGDAPLRYSLELTPIWVLTPGYRIVPPEVGDTLTMTADDRRRYVQFREDTRLLLTPNSTKKAEAYFAPALP